MRMEPWKLMTIITGLLIILGVVAAVGDYEPGELLVGSIFVAFIFGAMYVGWRMGRVWGERRQS